MDDFDFDWNDIDFGVDENFDYGSLLNSIDWNDIDFGVDENFDFGSVLSDIDWNAADFGVDEIFDPGRFAEDVEEQAGGFYGNVLGRAVYDPRTDITELYDPQTDILREIVHSTRAEDFGIMPDFDESEFTRDIYQPAEQGDIVITGPKPQDEFEEDLALDFWKNLIGPKDDMGTIEIVGKRPDTLLTDEEHTRQFEDTTEEDLKDKFWRELENKNENISSILTDEEHTRTGGDLKDPYEVDGEQGSRDEDDILTPTKKDPDPSCPPNSNRTVKYADGSTKTYDCKGNLLSETGPTTKTTTTTKVTDNKNLERILALLGGLMGLMGNKPRPVGYQGGIPKYIATRGTPRSPTEGGRRPGAAGIGSLTGGITYTPVSAAGGGLMGLAGGGKPARYLRGGTDGMADKIQTSIDGKQPARLSHGEFVIPADVVSHLGNGNSDAGADVLYDMMAKVRKARTGTQKQGKQINPRKYTPV